MIQGPRITSITGGPGTSAQIRYFLLSRAATDEAYEALAAASNWALLRKIALNLLQGDARAKTSLRGRRKKAGWDDAYMERILTSSFMR